MEIGLVGSCVDYRLEFVVSGLKCMYVWWWLFCCQSRVAVDEWMKWIEGVCMVWFWEREREGKIELVRGTTVQVCCLLIREWMNGWLDGGRIA